MLLPSGMIYDHKTMRVFQPFLYDPTTTPSKWYITVARVHEVGPTCPASTLPRAEDDANLLTPRRLLTDKPGLRTRIRRQKLQIRIGTYERGKSFGSFSFFFHEMVRKKLTDNQRICTSI